MISLAPETQLIKGLNMMTETTVLERAYDHQQTVEQAVDGALLSDEGSLSPRIDIVTGLPDCIPDPSQSGSGKLMAIS